MLVSNRENKLLKRRKMKTTERFDKAVTKLYNAFQENRLNAFSCEACAVGNILGNGYWTGGFDTISMDVDQKLRPVESFDIDNCGYNGIQLFNVEKIFILSHEDEKLTTKEKQFNGLCAVVEYLCELDNIPNVMDYTKLFETEDNKPKYHLS